LVHEEGKIDAQSSNQRKAKNLRYCIVRCQLSALGDTHTVRKEGGSEETSGKESWRRQGGWQYCKREVIKNQRKKKTRGSREERKGEKNKYSTINRGRNKNSEVLVANRPQGQARAEIGV